MLHCRTNRLHDRALRIVYSDYKSLFNTLLENDGSFQSNKEIFTIYLLKYINSLHDLSPAITGNIIKLNGPPKYNLRTRLELRNRNKKTVKYDTQTKSFLVLKIQSVAPQNIKHCTSLSSFKMNIRKWKPDYPCRLCKCF